jgi:hypothetical protein
MGGIPKSITRLLTKSRAGYPAADRSEVKAGTNNLQVSQLETDLDRYSPCPRA